MGNWQLWQRPKLRTDEEEGLQRQATWLELFYDLVFVVVIAELAHTLSESISPTTIAAFSFLFIPVWWVWIGVTFYNERFESNDISYRLFLFLQMIPVAAMAVFAHDAFGETSKGFALAYASARALLAFLWLRAGWYEKSFRSVSNLSAIGASISITVFVGSIMVPAPMRFVLWGIGLFVDLLYPWLTLGHHAKLPKLSSSRLPERFGLFTIIVLGESIVGVVSGVARNYDATAVGVTAILGLALAFGIWWVYFDFVARRPPKPDVWSTICWAFLHLPLVRLITGAVAICLITIGLLETLLHRKPDEPTHPKLSPSIKLLGGVLALLVGVLGGSFSQITLLALLTLLLLVQMIYGTYAQLRSGHC